MRDFVSFLLLYFLLFPSSSSSSTKKLQKEERLNVKIPTPPFNRSIVFGAPVSFDIDDLYFTSGKLLKGAWSMYTEWVNNNGGIFFQGEQVSLTLICVEDYSDTEFVLESTDYLLHSVDPLVDMFLAPYSSGLTNITSTLTEPGGKLLMASTAANERVFRNKNFTFSTTPPGYLYLEAAFRSLSNFNGKRVAILRDANDPICDLDNINTVDAIYPVDLYRYYLLDQTSPDYKEQIRTILLDLKENDVDVVMGCSYMNLCIDIPSISKSIDYNPDGMIFVICDVVKEVRDTLGDDAEYLLGVIPWVPTVNTVDEFVGWSAAEFQSRFETTYNTDPSYVAASAFAGIEILVAAVEATQSLDSRVIQNALETTTYPTLYANISFDDNHQGSMDVLVWQLRYNNSELKMDVIVDPPNKATAPVVWPLPTWKQRQCVKETVSCSSHGVCDSAGACVCEAQYYGSTPSTPCDTYCQGEIASSGGCLSDRLFYIGGLVDYDSPDKDEIISTMEFAVSLVNNYTDGWFDTTRQTTLVLKVENSECTQEGGEKGLRALNEWSVNTSVAGTTLDGLIGAFCSDGSIGASKLGNTLYVPQVSYASTSNVLSDKEEYEYFARSCYNDESEGALLVEALKDVGLTPFIAIVSTTDSSATSLSQSIRENYELNGFTVLLSLSYTPSSGENDGAIAYDYSTVLDELAASGAPVTVLVMFTSEVAEFIQASSHHPAFKDDHMVWVGIEAWVNTDATWNKQGMLGLTSYVPSSNATLSYIEMWAKLDPDVYRDSDGDRSTLGSNTLYVADAVFAMALAFQQAIDEESGLEGDLLKRHIFAILTQQVVFTGVTGRFDLLADGNRDQPIFGISNYGHSWNQNGFINDEEISVRDYSLLSWPDNSTGVATGYSVQSPLYCPAGMEPTQTSAAPVTYSCTQCRVGYYKPYVGSAACQTCPDGTQCNDVGIDIPCISPGYWRAEPSNELDLGDFSKYRPYSCDIVEGCVGGCNLNDTCSGNREPLSVTCGVCLEGHYLNYQGKCLACDDHNIYSPSSVVLLLVGVILMIGVLFFSVLSSLTSSEVKSLQKCGTSAGSGIALVKSGENRNTTYSTGGESRPTGLLTRISVAARNMEHFTPQNFRDVMITSKIVLTFFQVMSAFFLLDLSWSSGVQEFFRSYNINPFRGNEDVVACSTVSDTVPSYYFIVLNTFFLPLILILTFAIISVSYYHYHRYFFVRRCHNAALNDPSPSSQSAEKMGASAGCLTPHQKKKCDNLSLQIWITFSRLVLWLFLVLYPSICSIILSVFNCRDFGSSGIYLRVDNEISCEDETYKAYVTLSCAGIVLYVVGIPLIFFYAIKNRHSHLWQVSSRFLHHGFVDEWKYYEIIDLTRKLLITSISQFVASPSSSSQVLFMLLVDCSALFLLTSARPYQHNSDDRLSTVLTIVECVAFLFALLVVSGMSETEGYSEAKLFNTLLAMLIFGTLVMTPYTYMTKIDFFKAKLDALSDRINALMVFYFPDKADQLEEWKRRYSWKSWRSSASMSGVDALTGQQHVLRPSSYSSSKESSFSVNVCELSTVSNAMYINQRRDDDEKGGDNTT